MFIRTRLEFLNRRGVLLSLAACSIALGTTLSAAPGDQTKISKQEAEKIALTRVPDGTIKSAELETENGKLIWSFDISRPKTANITEIQVDAKKGMIVSEQTETPNQQATESQEDKRQGGE
jgi:Peptidase propeptide and YPEB domain